MNAENLKRYYEFSRTVSRKFDCFFLQTIDRREDSEIIRFLYRKFLQRKLGTVHQRVVHVFIAANLFGVDTEQRLNDLLRLAAVPELLIWSNYAINWVTDEKNNNSGTKQEENLDLIASQYLLTEALSFLPDGLFKRALELYRWVMRGFLTVERDLLITNYHALKDEQTFWVAYSRNHCVPDVGALYAFCFELVQEYFGINIEQKISNQIYKIELEFGRGLQVVGDTSDFMIPNRFVSTTEKRPKKDYFIDIRTDRLTYPNWLLLKSCENDNQTLFQEIIESARQRVYPDQFFYWKIYSYLKEHTLLERILHFLDHEKERLVKEIEKLSLDEDGKRLWTSSMVILAVNKFLVQIKKDFSMRRSEPQDF